MTEKLTPPSHIVGHMKRYTPRSTLEERKAWIYAMDAKGHRRQAIAYALGLSESGIIRIAGPRGANPYQSPNRRPTGLPAWGSACRWVDFSPEQRKALYEAARKNGCETPAEFMTEIVRDWLAVHAGC